MTKSNPGTPAWGSDVETAVEIPTGQSQQRMKASATPELRWDEDAETALVPVGAVIPAEAYRHDQPRRPVVASTPPAERDGWQAPPAPGADALSSTPRAQTPAPGVKMPRRTRRWLLPALLILLAFATTYVAMSMVREMRARPSGAASPSAWQTFVKVLGDARSKLN